MEVIFLERSAPIDSEFAEELLEEFKDYKFKKIKDGRVYILDWRYMGWKLPKRSKVVAIFADFTRFIWYTIFSLEEIMELYESIP
mgnify:CR=1 FL=1